MDNLDIQIKKLQETINVLLKHYKQVQKENEQLKNLNQDLEKQLSETQTFLQHKQEKQTAENIASIHNDDEKKMLQQKIDFYLKDIEKCLTILNA